MEKVDNNVLQTDTFLVEDTEYQGLSLFPQRGPLVARAVTHGVAIEVATVYMLQEDRFVFMLTFRVCCCCTRRLGLCAQACETLLELRGSDDAVARSAHSAHAASK